MPGPTKPFPGRVTFIYPSVGKESRTAKLRIEVANPDGLLRADMAATVEIEAPHRGGRWLFPIRRSSTAAGARSSWSSAAQKVVRAASSRAP